MHHHPPPCICTLGRGGFGRLRDALGGSGRLREALGGSGTLREALGGFGMLWDAPGRSGTLWEAPGRSGKLRDAPGRSGTVWEALGGSGRLWEARGRSGTVWEAPGSSGRLRDAPERSGSSGRLNPPLPSVQMQGGVMVHWNPSIITGSTLPIPQCRSNCAGGSFDIYHGIFAVLVVPGFVRFRVACRVAPKPNETWNHQYCKYTMIYVE